MAAASSGVIASRPTCTAGARTVAKRSSPATSATPSAARIPPRESSACETTSAAGDPAFAATNDGDGPAEHPADERPERSERGRLGKREQLDLPAARAEPRQTSPCVGRVAAERGRREDRECEQQCSALAAEQQEPSGGCT